MKPYVLLLSVALILIVAAAVVFAVGHEPVLVRRCLIAGATFGGLAWCVRPHSTARYVPRPMATAAHSRPIERRTQPQEKSA